MTTQTRLRPSSSLAPHGSAWNRGATECGKSDTTSGCGANPAVCGAFGKLRAAGCTLVFGETIELTGGERIVAARCRDDRVHADFMRVFDRCQGVINPQKSSDLSDLQPTQGNIAGASRRSRRRRSATSRRSEGNASSTTCSARPRCLPAPGLWFVDRSSAAESGALRAAAGYVVHFFPAGQGNVIGNPTLPVIRICAYPRTVRTMSEHAGIDTSGLLQREITMDQADDKLLDTMFRTANGRLTAAEAPGHREFALTRLHESA